MSDDAVPMPASGQGSPKLRPDGVGDVGTHGRSGGGESGGPYKGKVCGLDPCERQYGVPPYVRVNHGHVAHCQTATSGHCSSSDCFVNCDA